ncbi:MAG: RICIN domain-containing protein [Acidimicrobiaceae bacterium]|nr:RICIN domain-containing protein [Acidimicrobiaceae bacterium]
MSRRFFRRSGAALAGLALCGGVAVAGVAGTGTASADTSQYYAITLGAESSGLVLDVAGASTDPGAPVIQWYYNGGENQVWSVPGPLLPGDIVNANSGMCLTTDGVAGDQLYQEPCDGALVQYQTWYDWSDLYGHVMQLESPYWGLFVDVYQNSYSPGPIDAWYPNNQPNQFFEPGLSFSS